MLNLLAILMAEEKMSLDPTTLKTKQGKTKTFVQIADLNKKKEL
jgi:hypothetical protein